MIDLHLHLLPRVDDGAESIAESVEMCRLAAHDGCTLLVATPHRRREPWPDRPRAELLALLERVRGAAGSRPELALGAEVRVDDGLLRELDATPDAELPTLGDSNALLVELEPRGAGPEPVGLVRELVARGFRPLVAHPELTPCLRRTPGLARRMVEAGALLQVTAMSVTGELGAPARDAAAELFDAGLVHVLSSDAHRSGWRPPGLARARRVVAERWGEPAADAVTFLNARSLLAGRREPRPAASPR